MYVEKCRYLLRKSRRGGGSDKRVVNGKVRFWVCGND